MVTTSAYPQAVIHNPEGLTFADFIAEATDYELQADEAAAAGLDDLAGRLRAEGQACRAFAVVMAGEDPFRGDEAADRQC